MRLALFYYILEQKEVITILQIPTNVFPDDECVVIDKTRPSDGGDYTNAPRFTYTFHGDELRWGLIEYYNNTTEERIGSSYYPRGGIMSQTYHNGETVTINEIVFNDLAENGKNYKYRYTLFQTDPMTDEGEYNIYFCRGKIRALPDGASQVNTEVYINTEIENLKSAYRYTYPDSSVITVGGAYMEIGEERRFIESYDFHTGKVVLSSGFTTYPTQGTTYKIFTNYLLTPYYFVKCRALPTTSLTVTPKYNGIYCKLTYNQLNHVGLKCYKVSLFKTSSDDSGYIDGNIVDKLADNPASIKIESGLSDNIVGRTIRIERYQGYTPEGSHVTSNYYSSTIMAYDSSDGWALLKDRYSNIVTGAKYTIIDNAEILIDESEWRYTYDLDYTFCTNYQGNNYRIEYSVISQDDVKVTYNSNKAFATPTYTAVLNDLAGHVINSGQYVTFNWKSVSSSSEGYSPTHMAVFRKESADDKTPILLRFDRLSNYNKVFVDWSAANNHNYTYIFVLSNQGHNTVYKEIIYGEEVGTPIQTKWEGWSLLSLITDSEEYDRQTYLPNGIWTFAASMSSDDITTNIGVSVHTMTGIKPKTTRNDELYESGSFTSYVSTLNCSAENSQSDFIDDISRVKAWIKFCSRKCDYILKSDKGDSWIINISDNPTRNYDNSTIELLTTINYHWIECEDLSRIMFKG